MIVNAKRTLLALSVLGSMMTAPLVMQKAVWWCTAVQPMRCVKPEPKRSLKNTM